MVLRGLDQPISMFSLALLQEDVMSSKSNRTIAIINRKKDYVTIAASLPSFSKKSMD
jgi:hypothetical protein